MKKILIVEDDTLLNKTLAYNLASDGYHITSALNARTAANMLAETEFDLVLLDVNLPDGSGYDLCKRIKPDQPGTIVIFLTANEQRQALYALLDDPRITIISLDDVIVQTKTNLRITFLLLYGLAVFIALFALINLINTLITNLLTHQQEFGILQSVGMTGRQLSQMVSNECLCYVGASLLITFTIGTVCGIAAVQIFNQLGLFGRLTYHFPVLVMAVFSAALFAVYGVFRLATVRFLQKQSFVERIKTME